MTSQTSAPASLHARFTWESDGRLESYHILADEGPVRGDCDDWVMTVLYEVAGRSVIRMYWLLLTRQAKVYRTISPNGGNHLVLWASGYGWSDNWKDTWTDTVAPHTLRRRRLLPEIMLKHIIGLFDRT